MRHFSFRPALTLTGRRRRGLRGLAGKPFHPPLTDVPITSYLVAAGFDIVSLAVGGAHPVTARQFYVAATWLVAVGFAGSLLAALTGWADWRRSSSPGTQARRTINAHAIVMLTATAVTIVELALRFGALRDHVSTPPVVAALSIAVAAAVAVGATIGGSLVYDYGFNVETAGDHPVWHTSEDDVVSGSTAEHV